MIYVFISYKATKIVRTISESFVDTAEEDTLIPVPAPTFTVTPPELPLPVKPVPPVTDVIVPALLVKGKSLTAFT